MDKNSITGFVLIALLLFAFSWYNEPSAEQKEAERLKREQSLAIEAEELQKSQQAIQAEIKASQEIFHDSAAMYNKFGAFASSVTGTEQIIKLENDLISLDVTTKGAMIQKALLKNYDTYEDKPVVLFEKDEDNYSFNFVSSNQRIINSSEMYFEVIQNKEIDGNQVLRLRMNAGENAFMDFVYTLAPDSYIVKFDILMSIFVLDNQTWSYL